ncbi:MAG: branched-subunit amino acid aminotransferase/4-amino-4-deoxychorismate lyase [Myxococcota bacterium]|jgi:branched-subunit amino acid aminotransferase/4-amino-4-deoxychorismate lyase
MATLGERYFVDGAAVERAGFVVAGDDPGLIVGLNVFETLRTYNGQLFRAPAHADRLVGSAELLGVPCPDVQTLIAEWTAAVADFGAACKVRMTLTPRRRIAHVTPLDLDYVSRPLTVATRVWEPTEWLNGRLKHGSRANSESARRLADADEVFWVGRDGCLTEATRSSIFAAVDGVLVTPPDDGRILTGVTRGALLDAGRAAGIPVVERLLPRNAPMTELYATSTLKELAPVVRLDGEEAPGGGPLGDSLVKAYRALVARECAG